MAVTADGSKKLPLELWAGGLVYVARLLSLNPSPERVRQAANQTAGGGTQAAVLAIARSAGLSGRFTAMKPAQLSASLMPAIGQLTIGQIFVITGIQGKDAEVTFVLEGDHVFSKVVPLADLAKHISGPLLVVAAVERSKDPRTDDFLSPRARSWFAQIFTGNMLLLFELFAASFVSSLIAIATSLFSMQVYDRVVPSQSIPTLWVLASGVAVALLVDMAIRMLRTTITDHFGKRADLRLSALFFARTLDIKNDARPRSPGTLISQLRDLDQIREFLTSTTFSAAMDIPFVLTFLFIIWMLGGSIVFVPMAAIPLVIIPSLIAQVPLARLSQEGMAESALRNAILMESMYRIEDIKSLQAESRFRRLWEETNIVAAAIGMRQRTVAALLMNWTQVSQQLAYTGVIVYGVYGVLEGSLSFGSLLACSILTSRTIAPLGQIAAIFSRLQNVLVGRRGLNQLLALPLDHATDRDSYHRPTIGGKYVFENVAYLYGKESRPAIAITVAEDQCRRKNCGPGSGRGGQVDAAASDRRAGVAVTWAHPARRYRYDAHRHGRSAA